MRRAFFNVEGMDMRVQIYLPLELFFNYLSKELASS